MKKTKILSVILAIILSFCFSFAASGGAVYADYGVLEVHYLDVGQGDCAIIKLPDDKFVIVDAGDDKKEVKNKILDYIKTNFPALTYFDYAIATHTDSDHLGGMAEVLQKYPAKTVYRPNVLANYSGYEDPAAALTQDPNIDDNLKFWTDKGASVEVGQKNTAVYKRFIEQAYKPFESDGETIVPQVIISDGRRIDRPAEKSSQDIIGKDYKIVFYSPQKHKYSNSNDYSNIFILEFKGFEFFFSGDAESEAEKDFVKAYKDFDFDIDVFKLGHHGSRTSSSLELLELVTKESKRHQIYAIASCGLNNSYGHPHKETLDRLTKLGFLEENILRTDQAGDIVFEVRADSRGNYALYYNGQKVSEEDFLRNIAEFLVSLYKESPQAFYIALGLLLVLIVFTAWAASKSKLKSKK
ncbi:MAG TPA: MBL fold metallo-hydrolase [Clostridia bacterium]